jgi:hypothetical protein
VRKVSLETTPLPAVPTALVMLGCLVLPLYWYLSTVGGAFIDDAFITLQYASNLRDHAHWGFLPDRTTNTATSPLNVILTAGAGLLVSDIHQAAIWLATVESLALFAFLCLISRQIFGGYYFGFAGFLAIMANPLLMSTLGLESLLYVVLLTGCAYLFLQQQWYALAVLLALLTLTRPDGFLLLPVILLLLGRPAEGGGREDPDERSGSGILRFLKSGLRPSREKLVICGVYVLCLLPWYLFSWIHLGSFVPETLFVKMIQTWGQLEGLFFYKDVYPIEILASLMWGPLALLNLGSGNRLLVRFSTLLLLFTLVYVVSCFVLTPPPYHWYYIPAVIPPVLMGALGLAGLYDRVRDRVGILGRTLFHGLPVLSLVGIVLFFAEARGLPLAEAPIHSNWAQPGQFRQIGLWLKENLDSSSRIRMGGEIGTLAFYSQRRLMNEFSCRSHQQYVFDRIARTGKIIRLMARINFLWFEVGEPCGPYSHRVSMYMRRVEPNEGNGPVVKLWRISAKGKPEGTVILRRNGQG